MFRTSKIQKKKRSTVLPYLEKQSVRIAEIGWNYYNEISTVFTRCQRRVKRIKIISEKSTSWMRYQCDRVHLWCSPLRNVIENSFEGKRRWWVSTGNQRGASFGIYMRISVFDICQQTFVRFNGVCWTKEIHSIQTTAKFLIDGLNSRSFVGRHCWKKCQYA